MLKRIPKSDISIRPFKAYKEWSFESGSQQNAMSSSFEFNERVLVYTANSNFAVDEYVTMSYISPSTPSGSIDTYEYYPKSIYGQLRAQFYNGLEDNPFMRFGEKTNSYTNKPRAKERFLSGSAKIISIPQIYVGEGIKKGSFSLTNDNTRYFDDSYGNIVGDVADQIYFGKIDVENQTINFIDIADNEYSGTIDNFFLDIENNEFTMSYNSVEYPMIIQSFDIESGLMLVDNIPFLQPEAQVFKFGNIFYNQGLIVMTRESQTLLNSNWDLSFKSTKTIYEHEYLLVAEQDEFNVSTNPTAIVNVGRTTEIFKDSNNKTTKVITNPGVSYIKKRTELDNGEIIDYRIKSNYNNTTLGGFEHYFESSSVDSTGSFLTPYITTIGLYDDNCDLVAVAKLPQPIKSEHDLTVNFIVRFDT